MIFSVLTTFVGTIHSTLYPFNILDFLSMLMFVVLCLLSAAILAVLALSLRLLFLVRWCRRRPSGKPHPLKIAVVLGSGGHTGEMIGMLRLLGRSWLDHRCVYFVAETDKDSAGAAMTFERSLQRFASVVTIPRAREVGQSYVTSIWSTLKAARAAYKLVQDESPDVILVNGPGVCVPVVVAAFLSQIFCVGTASVPATAYIESFTCVSHLSVSGKVLRRLVDQFAVQWPQLKQSDWSLVGPFAVTSESNKKEVQAPLVELNAANVLAVVTVGSTKFDTLMREISSPTLAVMKALQQLKVTNLLIQKGRSDYNPFDEAWCATVRKELGITVEVVEYRKNISELFPRARVIISHAGAGTVLEAMRVGIPTVVVPNTDLMNNHQQELAEELAAKKVLLCAQCSNLSECLDAGRLGALHKFPDVPKAPYAALFDVLVNSSSEKK